MIRLPKPAAVLPILALALAGCGGGGGNAGVTVTLSPAEALKNVVASNDPECKAQNEGLTPTTAKPTTTTTRAPLPGQTTLPPTTAPPTTAKPVDPIQEYVKFATAVAVRKTQFQNLVEENKDFANQLRPIAITYAEADEIAQTALLPTARAGDPERQLSTHLDSIRVKLSSAEALAGGLGFKECAKVIQVPDVQIPLAPERKR